MPKSLFPALFGLAFDVEKTTVTKSGFKSAPFDYGSSKELFGALRLAGFAAAYRTGLAGHLVIAGGDERRYAGETPVINRAETIRHMLIEDFGVDPAWVTAYPSRSNTGGNITIFKRVIEERGWTSAECGLITNHYHIPRASLMAFNQKLFMPAYAAEAFLLLLGPTTKNDLIREFGEGILAERAAEEIQGVADMINGSYVARTDVAPVNIGKVTRSLA